MTIAMFVGVIFVVFWVLVIMMGMRSTATYGAKKKGYQVGFGEVVAVLLLLVAAAGIILQ
jgi:hypothetical protein